MMKVILDAMKMNFWVDKYYQYAVIVEIYDLKSYQPVSTNKPHFKQ